MSFGTITEFPVTTILEFATSGKHGLCPQLKSTINSLINSDLNSPASEQAVREAIDEISTHITYQNSGIGYSIYSSMSGNDIALYNSINPVSGLHLTGGLINNLIILSGAANPPVTGVVTGTLSVQGGLHQYSTSISASAIQVSGTLIANSKLDDVIGKIFVYCQSPFQQNSSQYTIGIDSERDKYIKEFDAPSTNGLVSTSYNIALSGEYDWIKSDTSIKIYRSGSQCNTGKVGISIFYDKVVWTPSYGYQMDKFDIQRFNMSDETNSSRGASKITAYYPGTISNNYYIYTGGGLNGVDTATIQRYDTKNDVVSSINRGSLNTARRYISTFKSPTKMYFSCGLISSSTFSGQTENVSFATDSANAVTNITLTPRYMPAIVYDTLKAYIAGGGNTTQTNYAYSIVQKIIYSTDTSYTATTALSVARYGISRFNTNINGWLIGGLNYTGSYYDNKNIIDKINYSTDTLTSTSSILPLNYSFMQSVQNNTYAYMLGGYIYSSSISSEHHQDIQRVQFSTNTYSVINNTINMESSSLFNELGASV